MIPPVLSTGALTPASVSPVISPGRLACGYALSDYGRKAAAILVILRNRILCPIAGSIFDRPPKLQAQYRRTTKSLNDLIALLKAASQHKRPKHGSPFVGTAVPELSNSLENLPARSRLIVLPLLNTEPLNTEHSNRVLIAIPNRNCLTHLVKQSACKELNNE